MGSSVKKVAKSFVTAGTDAIKSVGRGDIGGVLDAASRAASGGTISLKDKGLINLKMGGKAGKVSGSAEQQLLADQEANSRRRQRLYATSGAAKGEEVGAIGLAGDVRGSIFGNK